MYLAAIAMTMMIIGIYQSSKESLVPSESVGPIFSLCLSCSFSLIICPFSFSTERQYCTSSSYFWRNSA